MARLQVVSYTLTCDVCGAEIPESDSADASHKISWEGAEHAVDLCSAHQGELGQTLGQLKVFVDAGDRIGSSRGRGSAKSSGPTGARRRASAPAASGGGSRRSDLGAVRSWARENGYKVGDRARIARSVLSAYDEAHSSAPAAPPARKRSGRKAAAAS
ncbi:MAG: Lsr2 family protein [Actinomycetota bacterium]|nr:Lsr2 family protein [Actinomycetota bacterium]